MVMLEKSGIEFFISEQIKLNKEKTNPLHVQLFFVINSLDEITYLSSLNMNTKFYLIKYPALSIFRIIFHWNCCYL